LEKRPKGTVGEKKVLAGAKERSRLQEGYLVARGMLGRGNSEISENGGIGGLEGKKVRPGGGAVGEKAYVKEQAMTDKVLKFELK